MRATFDGSGGTAEPIWKRDMKGLKIAGIVIAAIVVIAALLLIVGVPSGFLTSTIAERIGVRRRRRIPLADGIGGDRRADILHRVVVGVRAGDVHADGRCRPVFVAFWEEAAGV